jgi:hypothetical protein
MVISFRATPEYAVLSDSLRLLICVQTIPHQNPVSELYLVLGEYTKRRFAHLSDTTSMNKLRLKSRGNRGVARHVRPILAI